MMDRRKFIQATVVLAGAGKLLSSCSGSTKVGGKIIGASAHIGHLVRDHKPGPPSEIMRKETVIIGGGVSGLSAARRLHMEGKDFLLLDLEKATGGNASWGSNNISPYPWGAHYVPLPNNDLTEYLQFLQSCGVITGRDENGLPIYNEEHLCFDPEERLYINGRWQEGLVPNFGVPSDDLLQIKRFLDTMEQYRQQKGSDHLDAFAIPVNRSSRDEAFTALDKITMKEWMEANGFRSAYLHEYVNYCTRDDFGTPLHKVSAWAGIHYFASRKGKGGNAGRSDVLTWPEGNGWLVRQLQQGFEAKTKTGCVALAVKDSGSGVMVDFMDVERRQVIRVEADHCIVAIPQFVASRILGDHERMEMVKQLQYVPWMVANLTVDKLEERSGAAPSWDNVIHGAKGLGYVDATHQQLKQHHVQRNLTCYLPLTEGSVADERKAAQARTHEEWMKMIVDELRPVHPNIERSLREVNVMVWGHSMAQPLPGIIHGALRPKLSASIGGRIHFAHTDLAGISIFEEGFYQGWIAANKILQHATA
jgi:protoporphyrinogen oxidase